MGISQQSIISDLRANGWSEKDIQDTFVLVLGNGTIQDSTFPAESVTTQSSFNKKIFTTVFAVIILIFLSAAGVYYFLQSKIVLLQNENVAQNVSLETKINEKREVDNAPRVLDVDATHSVANTQISITNESDLSKNPEYLNCQKEKSDILAKYQGKDYITPAILFGKVISRDPKMNYTSLEIEAGVFDLSHLKQDGSFCVVGNKAIGATLVGVTNVANDIVFMMVATPKSFTAPVVIDDFSTAVGQLSLGFLFGGILENHSEKITQLAQTLPEALVFAEAYKKEFSVTPSKDIATILEKPEIIELYKKAIKAISDNLK